MIRREFVDFLFPNFASQLMTVCCLFIYVYLV